MQWVVRLHRDLCHCEEGAKRGTRSGLSLKFLVHSGSPRPQGARDDNTLCHCEEGAERGTRQSIVSRGTRSGLSLRLLVHSGSPRPQGARDDNTLCHCEERAQARDAAIHRVSRDVDGFVCSVSGSQWIPTGLRPRDDKGGN
jgi:hypothetical protein